jgi:uncharacterized protein YigA (DUF484 family)
MTLPLDSSTVAAYLLKHPEFFQEQSALLTQIQVASPVTGRTISLQERQLEVMRDKYKALELRLSEFVRTAQNNDVLIHKFHDWTQSLLMARNDVDLPHVLINSLRTNFTVPHATLRLWRVAPEYAHTWFVNDVSEDAQIFSNSLAAPYCGLNNDFEVVAWLEEGHDVQSIAILPLRLERSRETFGLLVLGSPDPERFAANMATDFLIQISETASAALACLLA